MDQLIEPAPWTVTQTGFDIERNRIYESLFSLGNGHFGCRGGHEEHYSGDTLQGHYLAGVYYPDPTRVGWWKNGYPDYFAKVLNAADWTGIDVRFETPGGPVALDLATADIEHYERTLDLRDGVLCRRFRATPPGGPTVEVESTRFISMAQRHRAAIRYRLTVPASESGDAPVTAWIGSPIDGDVFNEDSNHEFGFWDEVDQQAVGPRTVVTARTKKTGFVTAVGAHGSVTVNGVPVHTEWTPTSRSLHATTETSVTVGPGDTVEVVKLVAAVTSRQPGVDPTAKSVTAATHAELDAAAADGFDALHDEHIERWHTKWRTSDVIVEGDDATQQGLRFNIFQLHCTFTGDDPDLNIGPKGFTGEKYGGVTYWDTEAFCLPFYLATTPSEVSKNLLRYRHRQLDKAIENGAKLGFGRGAALYPMVTINGEECHNEWEITFEEIHRNGAIAFAVFDYIRHTGDTAYLLEGGLEVLIAISRFWSQRVSWSEPKQAWVMLGVTGPNEYENNVNNNWYTNLMAQWTLRYTAWCIDRLQGAVVADGGSGPAHGLSSVHDLEADRAGAAPVLAAVHYRDEEKARWLDVAENIHLPYDPERGVFLQQDGYLDKELLTVDDLDPADRPLNQTWSWDRILRSCFIKQADVLQGIWVLADRFGLDELERNFDFYEPRTVHESSLSPSIHAVLAVRLGRLDKALAMLRRAARLDLDNYNNDTDDGLHITSMAGSWIATVLGFGGLRIGHDRLELSPVLAPGWTGMEFQVLWRGAPLSVRVDGEGATVHNHGGETVTIWWRAPGAENRVQPVEIEPGQRGRLTR